MYIGKTLSLSNKEPKMFFFKTVTGLCEISLNKSCACTHIYNA